MKTTRVAAAAALMLAVLAGCGEETDSGIAADPVAPPTSTGAASPTPDPSIDPDAGGIEHPNGADDVILRIDLGGGFVPFEYAFANQPLALLTGDGRWFARPEGGQQARLTAMTVAQLTEDQVQQLLELAGDAGLLAELPDYEQTGGPQIADAPTMSVALETAGGSWLHEAYALGSDETTDARVALSDFVADVPEVVDAMGLQVAPFEPSEVAILVQPTDLSRKVVAWPSDDVVLADSPECQVVAADGLVETLSVTGFEASFSQDGGLYSVTAVEVLPGDEPCQD